LAGGLHPDPLVKSSAPLDPLAMAGKSGNKGREGKEKRKEGSNGRKKRERRERREREPTYKFSKVGAYAFEYMGKGKGKRGFV